MKWLAGADSSAKHDTPKSIAEVIYEATQNNQNQLHHMAGDLSTTEYQWLRKEGIEEVMKTMNNRFFGEKVKSNSRYS